MDGLSIDVGWMHETMVDRKTSESCTSGGDRVPEMVTSSSAPAIHSHEVGFAQRPLSTLSGKAHALPAKRTPTPRSFGVGTLLRRGLAFAVLTAVLWWLVLPVVFPMSSQAVVNARLVQVRAPISGMATTFYRDLGNSVHAGEPLVHLVNPDVDIRQLTLLKTRQAELVARRELFEISSRRH